MSLFNRPDWARTQTAADDETEDSIFSHSNRTYAEIVADDQRKKKERAEKRRLKQEKKERTSADKREVKDENSKKHGSSPKRRRITFEEGEDLLGRFGPSAAKSSNTLANDCAQSDDISRRRSPRTNKIANGDDSRSAPPARLVVVDLGDSPERSDEVEISHVQQHAPAPQPAYEDSDDEFAELARQARARKLREDSTKKSQTPDANSPTPGQSVSAQSRLRNSTPPPDPVVKLFIDSRLPGTKPLLVYRKLSQRLQEIRKVWCDKQGFTDDQREGVFLIHRMHRVFDVTSCRSLGLDTNAAGEIVMKGAEGMDGVDQVHLEAVTEEIFTQLAVEREKEARRRQGLEAPEEEMEAGAPETNAASEEKPIRIVLRDGSRTEFKLKVKPVSTAHRLPLVHILIPGCRLRPSRKSWRHAKRPSTSARANRCPWKWTASDLSPTPWFHRTI